MVWCTYNSIIAGNKGLMQFVLTYSISAHAAFHKAMLAREEILVDYHDNIMRLEANADKRVHSYIDLYVVGRSHTV